MTVLLDNDWYPLNLASNELGQLATQQIETLLALKLVDNTMPLLSFTYGVTGSGSLSYEWATSSFLFSALGDGDETNAQSRWFVNYQPGKRQVFEMTWCITAKPTGDGRIDVGYFSNDDGAFYRRTADGDYFVLRSSGAEQLFPRCSWRDPLNGCGPSKETLNFETSVRMFVRFAWFGVGDIEYGFVVGRKAIVAYRHTSKNLLTGPYMRNPCLAIKVHVVGPNAELRGICAAVGSEGGQPPLGYPDVRERETVVTVPGSGAVIEIVSLRLATGIRKTVFPETMEVSTTSNQPCLVKLLWNPTFNVSTGWVAANTAIGEVLDYNISGRTITNEGTKLISSPVSASQRQTLQKPDRILAFGKDIDEVADVFTLAVKSVAAPSLECFGTFGFRVVP